MMAEGRDHSPVSTARRHCNIRLASAAALSISPTIGILLVVYTLVRRKGHMLVPIGLRDQDLKRIVLGGCVTAAASLWANWGNYVCRRLALTLLSILLFLGLLLLARGAAPTWPVTDGAMAELYTIHAAHGAQLLGAYSQYGWNHPGPLLFYVLAPVYVLSGHSATGLNAGALAVNLASVATIVWALAGRKHELLCVAEVTCGLLLLYVMRVPALLTSAWNLHPPVLAFAALLTLSAGVLAGELRLLPLDGVGRILRHTDTHWVRSGGSGPDPIWWTG
jgi:hypothetical protein